MIGLPYGEKINYDDTLSRFHPIRQRRGRTDGQICPSVCLSVKWKNAMKKIDFTPKNVINCVDNEPALWDTEFTDVHPEITARIDSYHWLSFLEAHTVLYASYLCLSLIHCLTHVQCFRFFDLAAIIAAPKLHTTTAVHATTISSSSSILRKTGRIYRSHTCGRH